MQSKTNINPNDIKDLADAKKVIILLCNKVEELAADNDKLRAENQHLRDEIAHLKGEQGKPIVKGRNQKSSTDISSEVERKKPKDRKSKGSKKTRKIRRTKIVLSVDESILPGDAIFKGYEDVDVQEIAIKVKNIRYRRETYYSPSLKKNFTADLPKGYQGAYGPGIRTLIKVLKASGNMTESKITELLTSLGVDIASSSVGRILVGKQEPFHTEKDDIFIAGLASSIQHHIDDTSNRVNGENRYAQVICNALYSAFFTTKHKNRLSILRILTTGQVDGALKYYYSQEAIALFSSLRISPKLQKNLASVLTMDSILSEEQLLALLESIGLSEHEHKQQLTRVCEALAIAYYHVQTDMPVIQILMCDDAPQFKLLTFQLALCWIHDGRHYKRLNPYLPHHQELLDTFLMKYWVFYHQLLDYSKVTASEQPAALETKKARLIKDFETLFSTVTDYAELDDRIAKTKAKKDELLIVLDNPGIVLHNNPAELAARAVVSKRDVSLQTRSTEGTKVQDTFLTITETAKKLRVNIYDYLFDRISGAYAMPSLADIIRERSQGQLQPRAGWDCRDCPEVWGWYPGSPYATNSLPVSV